MNRLVLVAVLLLGLPGAAMAQAIMAVGSSGNLGQVVIGNATSGTVTVQPVTGALGSVTASLPANTGTVAELNAAQSWTAAQTFGTVLGTSNPQSGTTYTLASTDCGKTLFFTNAGAVTVTIAASIAPAAGTTCNMVIVQGGASKVSVNGSAVSAASLVSSHSYTGTNGTLGSTIGIILTTVSATATAYLTGDGS